MEINAKKFYAPIVPSSSSSSTSTTINNNNNTNSNNVNNKRKITKEFLKLKNKLRKISKKSSLSPSLAIKMPKAYPKQQFAFDAMDCFNEKYIENKKKKKNIVITPIKNQDSEEDSEEEEEDKQNVNPNKFVHRIFSQELASTGKRTFLSCSIDTFFNAYLNIPPRQRHYYEIIRQHSPCRLYFDCEFYKEFNPLIDGNQMVDLFIRYVATALQSYFGIMVSLENFLDLDSSTDSKCSHHIIVHLPENQLFLNNIHVGNFVTTIANDCKALVVVPNNNNINDNSRRMKKNEEKKKEHISSLSNNNNNNNNNNNHLYGSDLWVHGKKEGEMCFFADLAVYTKNRAFRLVYSSKFKKDIILLPSKQNKFPVDIMSKSGEIQLFFDSLISYTINETPSSLGYLEFNKRNINNKNNGNNGGSNNNNIYQNNSSNITTKTIGQIPNEISEIVDYLIHVENISITIDSIRVLLNNNNNTNNTNATSNNPNNNENMMNNDTNVTISNSISSMHSNNNENYSYILATRTKKCRIAKRTHKSNHIWLKINMNSKTVFQHCHDEECRHHFYRLNVPEELFQK